MESSTRSWFVHLKTSLEEAEKGTGELSETTKNVFEKVWDWVVRAFENSQDWVVNAFENSWDWLADSWTSHPWAYILIFAAVLLLCCCKYCCGYSLNCCKHCKTSCLSCLGFDRSGVRGGSCASCFHSNYFRGYNRAGDNFARLQSVSMRGY